MRTFTLTDVPGISAKTIEAEAVSTVAAAMRAMKAGRASTAAGDNGAINVWIDDKGALRTQAYRFRQTISEETHETLADVKRWLKTWFPQIQ